MTTKKYTHLFFDLDNTIWDFNANSYDALQVALDKLELLDPIGSYDDFFKIYSDVNEKLWEQYRQGSMTKKVLSVQRFEESFEKHGTPLPQGGASVNYTYLLEMPLQTRLVDGARELLDHLHGKYEMSVITNGFKEVQYDKIQKSGLSKYFRKIFISEEIGAQKPHKQIFEHAVKSMNAKKKKSLMIGDSWDADIVGAMNFGIDQVFFSPILGKSDLTSTNLGAMENNVGFSVHTPQINEQTSIKINFNNTTTTYITRLEEIFNIL